MKGPGTVLGVVVGVFFGMYGTNYLFHHQTKISDDEILIDRMDVNPLKHTEYAVNLGTGDEEIVVFSLFGESWYIDYKGACQCITSVSKVGSYRVSLAYEEGKVYYSTGRTVRKTIPYEQVRSKFEEGMTIRNSFRERYADILKQ